MPGIVFSSALSYSLILSFNHGALARFHLSLLLQLSGLNQDHTSVGHVHGIIGYENKKTLPAVYPRCPLFMGMRIFQSRDQKA